MAVNGDHHVKQSKATSKREISHFFLLYDDLDLKMDMHIKGKVFVGKSLEKGRVMGSESD
jgi:hypothetical protein